MVTLLGAIGFWAGVGLVLYVYIGYPLTLRLLPPRVRKAGWSDTEELPSVTVVVAAHNEASCIGATVLNKLDQDYPAERLDVVVVSDGSIDGTDDIVRGLAQPRVTLLRQEPRQGKTAALNRGIAQARGSIIVISDANSTYAADTVRQLIAPFGDPRVGYATGLLTYQDPRETAVGGGSGLYIRYENWLRELETRVGSVVGVNGGVDAVRAPLYRPMRPDQLPDFVLPLQVVEQGFDVVFVPAAAAFERALGRQEDEYRMRVRVSLRALHALWEMRHLLGPRYGRFAFQLLVHKVLRYLLFAPLLLAFVSSALVPTPFYRAAFLGQLVCYLLALAGWLSGGRIRWKIVFLPFYFCLLNAAAAVALVRFLRGERQVMWTPRKGN